VHLEELLLFILAAVAVVVAVRWVSERSGLPAAALLTLTGIAYAYLPGPNVELDPELILTFLIPPLLYNAALDSSLIDIRCG
jgi:CPA1 family monovalent cation:H+ antiporter